MHSSKHIDGLTSDHKVATERRTGLGGYIATSFKSNTCIKDLRHKTSFVSLQSNDWYRRTSVLHTSSNLLLRTGTEFLPSLCCEKP